MRVVVIMNAATADGTRLYVKNVSLKFMSGAVAFLMSFASGVIVARVLGAEGNGTVALLILIPTMIAFFGSLGIDKANGYLTGAKKYTPQVLLGNSIFLSVTITLLIGIAFWWAMPFTLKLLPANGISRPMLYLAFLIVPFSLFEMYFQGILWGLGRILQLSIVSIIRFASMLILIIILVWILRLGIGGAILAAIATPAICVVIYAFFLRDVVTRLRFGYDKRSLKASFIFGLPAHLGNVMHFLNWRLDLLIVNYFVGVKQVGFYVVAASLAEVLWYLPDAFGFVLFPKTASSEPETARQFTPKVVRLSTFITAVAAVGLFLFSKLVITVLYTEEFMPSLYPLWILLPGVVALSYSKVIFSDLGGRGKPYYGTYASLFSLFVTLGLDLLLIPRWGIIGAAVVSSLAYTTNAVVAVVFYLRLTGNKLTDVLLVRRSDIEAGLNVGREIVLAIGQALHA